MRTRSRSGWSKPLRGRGSAPNRPGRVLRIRRRLAEGAKVGRLGMRRSAFYRLKRLSRSRNEGLGSGQRPDAELGVLWCLTESDYHKMVLVLRIKKYELGL